MSSLWILCWVVKRYDLVVVDSMSTENVTIVNKDIDVDL